MTSSGGDSDSLKEARETINEYRNSVLTASGLLIAIPFLAESILVSFGHFSHLQITLVTVPMIGSAVAFSITIFELVSSQRDIASATTTDWFLIWIQTAPAKELIKYISEDDRKAFVRDAPKIVMKPYELRSRSARLFGAAQTTFQLGVVTLVASLFVLGLILVA